MRTTTKIAISNLKSDKSRTLLTGTAIFLTTMLLTLITLGCAALIRENKMCAAETYGEHYGMFSRLTPEQQGKLSLQAQFYNVGLQSYVADGALKGYRISFYSSDPVMRMLSHFKLQSGSYPQAQNEILAMPEFFNAHGYKDPKIGDTVTIPLRINGSGKIVDMDFIISGFLPSSEANNLSKLYSAYVSEEFTAKSIPDPNDRNAYIGFQVTNEESLNSEGMAQKIKSLAAGLDIKESQISINHNYLHWELNPPTETIVFGTCTVFIILMVSILVIYNIFHVALIQKIREYGRLKALGANKKHLKQIVRAEGLLLAAFAIPAGILCGIPVIKIAMRAFSPMNGRIPVFSLPFALFVAALSFAAVLASIQKPLKTAAKTSPIEAMRYEAGGRELKRKGKDSVTIFGLTMSNLLLHKKRTVTTILTMGLSCVLFVIIANIAGNMDANRQTREDLEYGRFRLELDCSLDDKAYPGNNLNNVQKQNPLGEEAIRRIKAIDGVTEVRTRIQIPFYETNKNTGENGYITISVVNEEEFGGLVNNAARGTVDYQNTAAKDGVIYMWDHFLDDEYQIGDTFCGEILDGDRRVPFSAPLLGSCGHSNDATVTMTQDTFQKLELSEDMTSILFVDCAPENETAVKEQLERITYESDHLTMSSFSNQLALSHLMIDVTRGGCYTFLAILSMIGFMNMANTMITNILTRKREFGIMQAIGMSNRQLNRMLQLEGLVFTAGTLFVSLVLGNLLGYYAFFYCRQQGIVGLFEYHLPFLELGALVIGIGTLQMILAFVLSKNVKKASLVERIRYQE